jgi:hypothetical protein
MDQRFLDLCPQIEKYIVDGGIRLIKIWLEVGQDEQERRFKARINDPLRQWKLSPMDLESYRRWYDYSRKASMYSAGPASRYRSAPGLCHHQFPRRLGRGGRDKYREHADYRPADATQDGYGGVRARARATPASRCLWQGGQDSSDENERARFRGAPGPCATPGIGHEQIGFGLLDFVENAGEIGGALWQSR